MRSGRSSPVPGSGQVFQNALNHYIQNLEPLDAAWLTSCTGSSWERVVMELEALNRSHRESSAARKLLSRIRCFVDALRPFFGSIDMIMSNLQIGGLVWGALKLVIEVGPSTFLSRQGPLTVCSDVPQVY
jgi:hypothetical protein